MIHIPTNIITLRMSDMCESSLFLVASHSFEQQYPNGVIMAKNTVATAIL